ncbi:hypothetical protein DXG01_015717 [Tephrocybe rancida]|nr:hypothetical protein DXG01_015717 [Tephrocybe rancida]
MAPAPQPQPQGLRPSIQPALLHPKFVNFWLDDKRVNNIERDIPQRFRSTPSLRFAHMNIDEYRWSKWRVLDMPLLALKPNADLYNGRVCPFIWVGSDNTQGLQPVQMANGEIPRSPPVEESLYKSIFMSSIDDDYVPEQATTSTEPSTLPDESLEEEDQDALSEFNYPEHRSKNPAAHLSQYSHHFSVRLPDSLAEIPPAHTTPTMTPVVSHAQVAASNQQTGLTQYPAPAYSNATTYVTASNQRDQYPAYPRSTTYSEPHTGYDMDPAVNDNLVQQVAVDAREVNVTTYVTASNQGMLRDQYPAPPYPNAGTHPEPHTGCNVDPALNDNFRYLQQQVGFDIHEAYDNAEENTQTLEPVPIANGEIPKSAPVKEPTFTFLLEEAISPFPQGEATASAEASTLPDQSSKTDDQVALPKPNHPKDNPDTLFEQWLQGFDDQLPGLLAEVPPAHTIPTLTPIVSHAPVAASNQQTRHTQYPAPAYPNATTYMTAYNLQMRRTQYPAYPNATAYFERHTGYNMYPAANDDFAYLQQQVAIDIHETFDNVPSQASASGSRQAVQLPLVAARPSHYRARNVEVPVNQQAASMMPASSAQRLPEKGKENAPVLAQSLPPPISLTFVEVSPDPEQNKLKERIIPNPPTLPAPAVAGPSAVAAPTQKKRKRAEAPETQAVSRPRKKKTPAQVTTQGQEAETTNMVPPQQQFERVMTLAGDDSAVFFANPTFHY